MSKTIKKLKETIKQLKEDQEKQYIHYKYVELKQKFQGVRDYYGHQNILTNMWQTGRLDCSSFIHFPIADNSNALAIILSLCDIQWTYQEKVDPISVYPYHWCCDCDVDMVVSKADGFSSIKLYVGKKFYMATSVEDQKKVYYVIYVFDKFIRATFDKINREDDYRLDNFHDDVFVDIIQRYILPYKVPPKTFLQTVTFKDYLDKKGSFDNFFSGHAPEKDD